MTVLRAKEYVVKAGPHARERAAALRIVDDCPPEHRGNGSADYFYSEEYFQRGGQPPAEPGARAARQVKNRAKWTRKREQERVALRRARLLAGLAAADEARTADERWALGNLADEWIADPHT